MPGQLQAPVPHIRISGAIRTKGPLL